MRKNIMKIGTMALAASMMLTPVSNVFAAGESQKMLATDSTAETFTDTGDSAVAGFTDFKATVEDSNLVEEPLNVSNKSEIEPTGLFTTAYVVTFPF